MDFYLQIVNDLMILKNRGVIVNVLVVFKDLLIIPHIREIL